MAQVDSVSALDRPVRILFTALLVLALWIQANQLSAAPKPEYGVLTLTNTPGPVAEFSLHTYRVPQHPTIAVFCDGILREMGFTMSGPRDGTVSVTLPEGARTCTAWAQSEGAPNGKPATLISNVVGFEVVNA